MATTIECIRCHTRMENGLVGDLRQGGYSRQNWYPGEPSESFWAGGLKMDAKLMIPVSTLRCPKCGYLESYAPPA